MRTRFPQYYKVTTHDLLEHFDNCMFIFDTNALLDIFRLPAELTNDVLSVIQHYKNKIRVPFHVAEEYYEDLYDVIADQIRKIDDSCREFNKCITAFEAKRSHPYIRDCREMLKPS